MAKTKRNKGVEIMEMLNEMLIKYLLQFVIVALVSVVTYVILPALKKALEAMKDNENTKMLYLIASTVVESIEQEFWSEEGQRKKILAKQRFIEMLKDKGIELPESQLDAYIEQGVYLKNTERKALECDVPDTELKLE